MKKYRVFVGLGSNRGDRAAMLRKAAESIRRLPETSDVAASAVFETDPFGIVQQPRFLNAVMEIETALEPGALLKAAKDIEVALGRTRSERWGPREIDIDILLYDGVVFKDETVEVPHPGLAERRFVLVPFRDIGPDVVHPVSGLTVEEMAAACSDRGRVVRTSYVIR